MSKFNGKVKWFSNRKGFGFITPTSDDAPTKEDIFVHHTNIVSEGTYRTLTEGYEVQFEVLTEESGKLKCNNVTAPGGGPCDPPAAPKDEKRRTRRRRGKGKGNDESGEEDNGAEETGEEDNNNNAEGGDGAKKDGGEEGKKAGKKGKGGGAKNGAGQVGGPNRRRGPWHSGEIADNVKEMVTARGLSLDKTTIDVSTGGSRIKISAGGYVAVAHSSGTLAEGSYTLDDKGEVKMEWKHVLMLDGDEWKVSDASNSNLVASINFSDETLTPVKEGETAKDLWGDKKDPTREMFEQNGFTMRRVILEKSAISADGGGGRGNRNRNRRNRGGARGRGRGGRGGGGKSEDEKEDAAPKGDDAPKEEESK